MSSLTQEHSHVATESSVSCLLSGFISPSLARLVEICDRLARVNDSTSNHFSDAQDDLEPRPSYEGDFPHPSAIQQAEALGYSLGWDLQPSPSATADDGLSPDESVALAVGHVWGRFARQERDFRTAYLAKLAKEQDGDYLAEEAIFAVGAVEARKIGGVE